MRSCLTRTDGALISLPDCQEKHVRVSSRLFTVTLQVLSQNVHPRNPKHTYLIIAFDLAVTSSGSSFNSNSAPVAVFYFYLDPLSSISGKAEILRFYQFISVSWSVYCGLIALNPPQHFINIVSNSRQLKTIHPNRISGEKCTRAHGFCTVILIFGGVFSCVTVFIWLLPHTTENPNEVLLPGLPSSPFNLLLL